MLRTPHAPIILLIADGFDETAVSILVATLRGAGLLVIVVSLRAGIIRSVYGLTLVADKSLEQILENPGPVSALILPGRAAYLARLQSDPRVGRLLVRCVEAGTLLVGGGGLREKLPPLPADFDDAGLWLTPEPGHTPEEIAAALVRRLQHNQGG